MCNTGAIDYTDPDTAYDIASFVRNIYFVKMFYTSEFNYDLYNPPQSLSEALETISEPPAPLALSDKQLKEHISLFYSFSTLAEIENKKDARKALKMYEKDYMRLIHFFPQEIWPLYWLGRV